MNRGEGLNGFDFHHHSPSNHKVRPIASLQLDIFVDYRQRFLTFELEPTRFEFAGQAFFINCFEQTRAERAVNIHRRSYDCMGEFVVRHEGLPGKV